MKIRVISGAVLVVLALGLIILGGDILMIATFAISLIGMYELYRAFACEKTVLALFGYLGCAFYYIDLAFLQNRWFSMFIILFLILLLAVLVFAFPKYTIRQVAITYFGLFYVAVMLSYVYRTREMTNGIYIVWLIFLCSWIADTCAYFTGVLFGKHKLVPKLSPKKTVEGAIGGVIGPILLTAIFLFFFRDSMGISTREQILLSVSAGAGAVISMIGDLAASAIKRNCEIKDFGKLIPGHGGILDRFDSVIITAPIIFYLGGLI